MAKKKQPKNLQALENLVADFNNRGDMLLALFGINDEAGVLFSNNDVHIIGDCIYKLLKTGLSIDADKERTDADETARQVAFAVLYGLDKLFRDCSHESIALVRILEHSIERGMKSANEKFFDIIRKALEE